MFKQKGFLPLALALLLLLGAQFFMSPPPNWTPSFSGSDEIPYGADVFYKSLAYLFPGQEVRVNRENFYTALADQPGDKNLIMLGLKPEMDNREREVLFDWVKRGGMAFIAAGVFDRAMRDSLELGIDIEPLTGDTLETAPADTMNLSGVGLAERYFSSFDSGSALVLLKDARGRAIYLKQAHGRGFFYLNLRPFAFVNYNILMRNSLRFVEEAMLQLPPRAVIWDEYHKPLKKQAVQTPLRYVLEQPALRAAWFTLLALIASFLLLGGRRRQKAIPLIEAPKNESVNYLKTLGRFSVRRTSPLSLIKLKKKLALAWLRQQYGLDARALDKQVAAELARRQILTEKEARQWVMTMSMAGKKRFYQVDELKRMAAIIQKIYRPRT